MSLRAAGARHVWFDGLLTIDMHASLHTAAANADTELRGGGYARVHLNGGAWTVHPTTGVATNDQEIAFPVPTATWPAPTHVGFWTAISGGDLMFSAALVIPPGELPAGSVVRIGAGLLALGGSDSFSDTV